MSIRLSDLVQAYAERLEAGAEYRAVFAAAETEVVGSQEAYEARERARLATQALNDAEKKIETLLAQAHHESLAADRHSQPWTPTIVRETPDYYPDYYTLDPHGEKKRFGTLAMAVDSARNLAKIMDLDQVVRCDGRQGQVLVSTTGALFVEDAGGDNQVWGAEIAPLLS